jgi:hypothetical protein
MDMVAYPYNPSIWRLRQEDCKFLTSLGYIARPYLKNKKSFKKKENLTKC